MAWDYTNIDLDEQGMVTLRIFFFLIDLEICLPFFKKNKPFSAVALSFQNEGGFTLITPLVAHFKSC